MVDVKEIEMSEEEYEAYLNDIYPPVNICGYTQYQGTILREIDPIAFRCGISEEPLKYRCGECGEEYEDEDEAEDCCKE